MSRVRNLSIELENESYPYKARGPEALNCPRSSSLQLPVQSHGWRTHGDVDCQGAFSPLGW